jgi:hypothetical protein
LVLGLAAVTVAVEPLLRGPASTRRVVSLLVAGELSIHVALTLLTELGARGSDAMAGMHHSRGVFDVLPHLVSDLSGRTALMIDAHLAAMVVVGLWLAAGERALWTLLSLAIRPCADAVQRFLGSSTWVSNAAAHVEDGRLVRIETSRRPIHEASMTRRVTRRGPPSCAAHPLGV